MCENKNVNTKASKPPQHYQVGRKLKNVSYIFTHPMNVNIHYLSDQSIDTTDQSSLATRLGKSILTTNLSEV